MGNAKSHRKLKSETVPEKAWYEWDLYQVTFRGCPYCQKKMSQSASENCVFTHMLAYYRYKTIRMLQDDPEYWFAKWGAVLPDDPLTDSGIRFDKFNHLYWERKEMEELAEKVDTKGYDLNIARAIWSDFQKEWRAERIGDFSAYRRTFRQILKELRVQKPGDLVYAKYAGTSRSSWNKATVKAIDTGKIRVVHDVFVSNDHPKKYNDEWIILDRQGRSWLKAYSSKDPDDEVRPPKQLWKMNDRVSAQDHLGKWYEAVIHEIRGDQVLVHYEGWPDRYNEWIDCDSKRIKPLYTHTNAFEEAGMEDIEFPFEPSVPDPPEPAFESTLRRHVVADLAEFVQRNHVPCGDCNEPMTTQTFHLSRCFHMICKLCTHNRGDRCFCGRLFATPMAMPAVFETALSQIGTLAKWECVVCTEPMTTKNFHLTSCFHKVCTVCVAELAKRDPRCPVCREKINA